LKPRDSIFGSSIERRCYGKLQDTWGDKYAVYHNQPFLSIFQDREAVTADEFDFLKKTSVDFVICSKDGRPLVCIEFDGMQHGHNVGSLYQPGMGQRDRDRRRRGLELKLRIAHEANFPFFVLSGEHFKGFSDGVRLSLVDAIIGEIFASQEVGDKFRNGFNPNEYGLTEEEFNALPFLEQRDMIEDWAIGVEVVADFTHNPIFKKVAELEEIVGLQSHSQMYTSHPDFPSDTWSLVDCSATDKHGRQARTRVCIPNFKTPGCVFTVHIANEIGLLVCLEQLRCQGNTNQGQ